MNKISSPIATASLAIMLVAGSSSGRAAEPVVGHLYTLDNDECILDCSGRHACLDWERRAEAPFEFERSRQQGAAGFRRWQVSLPHWTDCHPDRDILP